MTSEQGSNAGVSKEVATRDSMRQHHPEETESNGIEYELEENLSDGDNSTPTSEYVANAAERPAFEKSRHPNAKLFVVMMALLCNVAILVQALSNLGRQYSPVFCTLFELEGCAETPEATLSQGLEFCFRFVMELVVPMNLVLVFIFSQLIISISPRLSLLFKNPVPSMIPLVVITCFFYSITCFLTSISMLPALAATSNSSVWLEYLANTVLGLFWMYSFINIFAFGQLTEYNFIRARESLHINNEDVNA